MSKLLSIGSNAKTKKSDAGGEYLTAILYMAPAQIAGGKSLCPGSTAGCREVCLYTAGRGNMSSVQKARIAKAEGFLWDHTNFLATLANELSAFRKKCKKLGVKPAVRLNGTTDILWERIFDFAITPDIQYYDYTKIYSRLGDVRVPKNYHLTYSKSEETTEKEIRLLNNKSQNVAVVFRGPHLPKTYLGIPVINGDLTDLRFTDPSGVIVGLLAKGKAKGDTSGFVVDV